MCMFCGGSVCSAGLCQPVVYTSFLNYAYVIVSGFVLGAIIKLKLMLQK